MYCAGCNLTLIVRGQMPGLWSRTFMIGRETSKFRKAHLGSSTQRKEISSMYWSSVDIRDYKDGYRALSWRLDILNMMIMKDRHELVRSLKLPYLSNIRLTHDDKENPTLTRFIDKYGGKMDDTKQSWSEEIEEWMDSISSLDEEKVFRDVKLNMGVWIQEWKSYLSSVKTYVV